MEQVDYALALSIACKASHATYKRLVTLYGTAQALFTSTRLPSGQDRAFVAQVRQQQGTLLRAAQSITTAHQVRGFCITPYEASSYPERLRHIHTPPAVLYATKPLNLNKRHLVAIVGTRKATHYGKAFVSYLVEALRPYDVVIVSGLAYGIDVAAHRAALDHQITTVAVLAGGIDSIYPAAHTSTAQQIKAQGNLISEHPLGTQLARHHFPTRNRIIAGMADAVIIVEAGAKSGALITAQYANAFGGEVFALPSQRTSSHAQGCHHLIKTHQAHMITDVQDLIYIMNWAPQHKNTPQQIAQGIHLSKEEHHVVSALRQKSPAGLDELHHQTNLPITHLLSLALQLEVKNLIRSLPDSTYTLKVG